MIRSRIVSTGIFVPPKVVTNKDLEEVMETTDEWIQQRSGIKERRFVEPGVETTLSMALASAKQALDRAKLKADDIDLIIFGCLISDYVFPGTGVLIQRELGFTRTVPALDIRNQCAGFVYAVNIADAMIRMGTYKRVLIVGSEIHSTTLEYTTRGRNMSVLFGDAAGAMIVEAVDVPSAQPNTTTANANGATQGQNILASKEAYIIDSVLHSEGKFAEDLALTKPSSNDKPRYPVGMQDDPAIYPHMDGKLVFKNAINRMTEVLTELLGRNGLKPSDLDFVIAHQANMRINQMVLENLGLPAEKTHNTLDHYGNTTMATVPLTFDEAILLGKIKRGDLVAFVAFGAGFTWGANLFRY